MTVVIDGESLTIPDVVQVARNDESVRIDEDARVRVRSARQRVDAVLDADDPVYGINTGFGELVDTRIPRERLEELQYNLVRSHAAGTGPPADREIVRAILLTRLNALLKGYSGVREVVVDRLADLLNNAIHPVIPTSGSLGASGDLAPLAHLALVLIGEGETMIEEERTPVTNAAVATRPAAEALESAGLSPITLQAKEGLALINGTQFTLAIAALLVHDGERVCRAADAAGALTTEVSMGTTAACASPIHDLRPHPGQRTSASNVRSLTADSEVVESHRNCDRVQDAYSIRCLPQIHGTVRDSLAHLRTAVETELNSATDNPLVFPGSALDRRASGPAAAGVVSGGNFHGGPLAHRLEYLAATLTDLAVVCERRVDQLLNPNIQEPYLTPFLAVEPGVESGLMIAQYSAASIIAECRSIGRAASDSIPVSGGQEDHVSMSATAAINARWVCGRVHRAVAIELLCAAEAAEYLDPDLTLGVGTDTVYRTVRAVVPEFTADRRLDRDIEAIAQLIADGSLDDAIREVDVGIE